MIELFLNCITLYYIIDEDEINKLHEFRDLLMNTEGELYERNLRFCSDMQLVRFLVARKYDLKQAHDLFKTAFDWREVRKPELLEACPGWYEAMEIESQTGWCYIYIYV